MNVKVDVKKEVTQILNELLFSYMYDDQKGKLPFDEAVKKLVALAENKDE